MRIPQKMRIVFMGTSEFSVIVLEQLLKAGISPQLVLSQPARMKDRGMKMQPSPLAEYAEKHGLSIITPHSLEDESTLQTLQSLDPDLAIIVSYGQKLPPPILEAPRFGCINIHPSLLPRWRGAAPIQRAIEAGDTEGGVCIIKMDTGIDTGPILAQSALNIDPDITAQQWHDVTAREGAKLTMTVLENIADITPVAQSTEGVCYAKMFRKNDLMIDFHRSATDVLNHIRAFSPKPGAWCLWKKKRLCLISAKILKQSVSDQQESGTIVGERLMIQTGTGIIQPRLLQLEGRKVLPLDDFLRGQEIPVGTLLQGKR